MNACSGCGGRKVVFSAKKRYSHATLCPRCSSFCKRCKGTGLLITRNSEGESFMADCDCRTLARQIENFNLCGIPQIYRDAEWENFDDLSKNPKLRRVIEQSRKVLEKLPGHSKKNSEDSENRGILFHGNVGTGKTRLLSVVLKSLTFEQSRRCKFVEFTELLYTIRNGYDKKLPESEFLYPLCEVEVLGIDELGKGRGSEWENTILDRIISHRYNSDLLTFFTTNFPEVTSRNTEEMQFRETICERVGSRIYSRLKEMCLFLKVDAEDYRLKQEILIEKKQQIRM